MITPLAATSDESDLLIYEVSDEVLETAGSNETARGPKGSMKSFEMAYVFFQKP